MGSANRFMSYSFDLASGHPKCVFDYMSLFFFPIPFSTTKCGYVALNTQIMFNVYILLYIYTVRLNSFIEFPRVNGSNVILNNSRCANLLLSV